MSTPAVLPRSYVPQDTLHVWTLVNPAAPVLTGSIALSALVPNCATFNYAADWWEFALSEDLPLVAGQTFSAGQKDSAPGAIDDARPDRWGERIIRHVDRPARLSILEMLLFAGDDRFGALGISTSADRYVPRRIGPYPQLRDLPSLVRAVEDVQAQAPITSEIQRLVQPGVTLGGARPKALLQTDSGACVIKFSELDDPVDTPLIEHATMTLAAKAGIRVATTGVLPLPLRHAQGQPRHALTIQRFDRLDTGTLNLRLHCTSARTALAAAGLGESYGALATVLLRQAHPDRQKAQREELFQRMVFNILMDNTDDHERNHCLRLGFDGYYELSPAFDVVPTLQNMGYQAMVVGRHGAESTLENALTDLSEFGITRARAVELIQAVARTVDQWPQHFARQGVGAQDMELLHASIDRDALKAQRQAFC
ncbi:type II toxin-antitoxin system HipA family toxin [Paracidovorax valerianellae]|uniref:Serine/threonine-protein kinase HipA n=1 Tax=Paracidovorax valerianellae TaxID=187868 RepID=A0A1G6PMF0_9BURK|nr:HipA domain-containing protein [Paracidovorax valerianellae]MDA8444927.1 type II toxin-antitoxin system HipA family toxin [Paracidovorax valerianellae]SDC81442.1 serine/threonine-protein kinase HipA [Paracidovorax valerianellae]